MKKAQGLSTICTSALAALLAAPAPARVPGPEACFTRSYDPAHLARNPGQGVRALRLWFYDAVRGDPTTRSVIVEAVMADQGQARADGVGGMTLRQSAFCTDEGGGTCFVECDGGSFVATPRPGGGLDLVTDHFAIGEQEHCGGHSSLSEGGRTVYRLDAAAAQACADLAHVHPLPEPGCYGAVYPQGDATGRIAAMTLRVQAPPEGEGELAFPWIDGVLQVDLSAAPVLGTLAGRRVQVPIWCGSGDGICRSGVDEGGWAISPDGADVVLTSSRFVLFDPDGARAELAGGTRVRHVLAPLPGDACAGMVVQ